MAPGRAHSSSKAKQSCSIQTSCTKFSQFMNIGSLNGPDVFHQNPQVVLWGKGKNVEKHSWFLDPSSDLDQHQNVMCSFLTHTTSFHLVVICRAVLNPDQLTNRWTEVISKAAMIMWGPFKSCLSVWLCHMVFFIGLGIWHFIARVQMHSFILTLSKLLIFVSLK